MPFLNCVVFDESGVVGMPTFQTLQRHHFRHRRQNVCHFYEKIFFMIILSSNYRLTCTSINLKAILPTDRNMYTNRCTVSPFNDHISFWIVYNEQYLCARNPFVYKLFKMWWMIEHLIIFDVLVLKYMERKWKSSGMKIYLCVEQNRN